MALSPNILLPPEIRSLIYQELFRGRNVKLKNSDHFPDPRITEEDKYLLAITLVSKQVRAEALAIFLSEATFRISLWDDYLNRIPTHIVSRIDKLRSDVAVETWPYTIDYPHVSPALLAKRPISLLMDEFEDENRFHRITIKAKTHRNDEEIISDLPSSMSVIRKHIHDYCPIIKFEMRIMTGHDYKQITRFFVYGDPPVAFPPFQPTRKPLQFMHTTICKNVSRLLGIDCTILDQHKDNVREASREASRKAWAAQARSNTRI